MSTQVLLEFIGYTGSFLVIVSMLMTSIIKLRIINTVGSTIFLIYALCIHSYPTAAMQACLIIINFINLRRLLNIKKHYLTIQVKADDGFLNHLLNANHSEIKKFFPDFFSPSERDKIFIVMCSGIPAGIFIAEETLSGNLEVKLDYTTPSYRDCSVGKYLYKMLKTYGIKKLVATTKTAAHKKYLQKMGFIQNEDTFVKQF